MSYFRKSLVVCYDFLIEIMRTGFNKIFYISFKFFLKLFKINNTEVYSDSNGWFITFRYKNYIYKLIGPFIFLKKRFSWNNYKKLILELSQRVKALEIDSRMIPELSVYKTNVRFFFITDTVTLEKYLTSCVNSNVKVEIFIELFNTLDLFHKLGFLHGDLKPKNILVKNKKVYFIDLESIKYINEKNTVSEDYKKLIPRIIYHLNEEELRKIIHTISSKSLIEYIEKYYMTSYDIRQHLKKFHFVIFEDEIDNSYNSDIDIEVPSFKEFQILVKYFKKLDLDMIVFYCCVNDLKIYLYNGILFKVVDVHLSKYISVYKLLYLKLIKNTVNNIFITGPDGVGKTTLIDTIINNKSQNMLKLLNLNCKHANRFVQSEFIIKNNKLERFLLCKPFGCLLKKNLLLLKFKFLSKSLITIYDRSFLDIFLNSEISFFHKILINNLGHKKDIILLKDTPNNIYNRKQELSLSEIKQYYLKIKKLASISFEIDMVSYDSSKYQLYSIIRYKVLTKK